MSDLSVTPDNLAAAVTVVVTLAPVALVAAAWIIYRNLGAH